MLRRSWSTVGQISRARRPTWVTGTVWSVLQCYMFQVLVPVPVLTSTEIRISNAARLRARHRKGRRPQLAGGLSLLHPIPKCLGWP